MEITGLDATNTSPVPSCSPLRSTTRPGTGLSTIGSFRLLRYLTSTVRLCSVSSAALERARMRTRTSSCASTSTVGSPASLSWFADRPADRPPSVTSGDARHVPESNSMLRISRSALTSNCSVNAFTGSVASPYTMASKSCPTNTGVSGMSTCTSLLLGLLLAVMPNVGSYRSVTSPSAVSPVRSSWNPYSTLTTWSLDTTVSENHADGRVTDAVQMPLVVPTVHSADCAVAPALVTRSVLGVTMAFTRVLLATRLLPMSSHTCSTTFTVRSPSAHSSSNTSVPSTCVAAGRVVEYDTLLDEIVLPRCACTLPEVSTGAVWNRVTAVSNSVDESGMRVAVGKPTSVTAKLIGAGSVTMMVIVTNADLELSVLPTSRTKSVSSYKLLVSLDSILFTVIVPVS